MEPLPPSLRLDEPSPCTLTLLNRTSRYVETIAFRRGFSTRVWMARSLMASLAKTGVRFTVLREADQVPHE